MGDSVGVALDVVDVVCGEGGVGCLVRVGVRSVGVVFRPVLAEVEVVQFAGGENFSARVVVCSVLDEVEVASLDHCSSFLVFNFWNCWVKWV